MLPRLAVWLLPAISVSFAMVSQFIVPRLLQLGLSEAYYTGYIAITSVVAYVGLA